MFFFVILLVTLALNNFCVYSVSGSSKCNINDLDVSNCVLKALRALRPQTKIEETQIKLFPSEPFVIPLFHIAQDSIMMNYTAKNRNFTIRGMDDFDLKDIRFDPTTMTFYGTVEYDPLSITSNYEINGHWISIPIRGKGVVHSGLGPINAKVEVTGKMTEHKNVYHYNPTELKVRMVIDDVQVYLEGLFEGNQQLERVTNQVLNNNSKLLVLALTPPLEKLSETVFLDFIKSTSNKILYVG